MARQAARTRQPARARPLLTDVRDVTVIGAGLVGLATAYQLLQRRPDLKLAVVEKEPAVALHQSGRNSGVVHAGLYYAPGSLKARLCREGRAALLEFADARGIAYNVRGKVVVAVDERELPLLAELERRARANGLQGLRVLDARELQGVEPNVRGIRALHVPESAVIDFAAVARALAEDVRSAGGELLLGRRVDGIEPGRVQTGAGAIETRAIVACGGLHADRLADLTRDAPSGYRIVPFRGDYYAFAPGAEALVNGLVYPVPDPAFPFLGVHFTRRVDGRLVAGPNAVPALAREGYRRTSFSARDVWDTVSFPGFRRLARSYARLGAIEIWRDLVKAAAVAEMRRYIPAIESRHVRFGPSGVRAQCLRVDGTLQDDFLVEESPGALHVLNAPSPAATASLAIGALIADRALAMLERAR